MINFCLDLEPKNIQRNKFVWLVLMEWEKGQICSPPLQKKLNCKLKHCSRMWEFEILRSHLTRCNSWQSFSTKCSPVQFSSSPTSALHKQPPGSLACMCWRQHFVKYRDGLYTNGAPGADWVDEAGAAVEGYHCAVSKRAAVWQMQGKLRQFDSV